MPSSTVPTVIFPYRSIFPRDPSPRSSPIRVRKYANTSVPRHKRRWPGTAIVPVFERLGSHAGPTVPTDFSHVLICRRHVADGVSVVVRITLCCSPRLTLASIALTSVPGRPGRRSSEPAHREHPTSGSRPQDPGKEPCSSSRIYGAVGSAGSWMKRKHLRRLVKVSGWKVVFLGVIFPVPRL